MSGSSPTPTPVKKISDLPPAQLPLSGNEAFIIEQNGSTVNLTVEQLQQTNSPANLSTAWVMQWGGGAVVFNGTYYFTLYAPYNGSITSMDWIATGGIFNATVTIAGAPVIGLNNVIINSNGQNNTVATNNNAFTVGQTVSVTITNITTAILNTVLSLRITKSL